MRTVPARLMLVTWYFRPSNPEMCLKGKVRPSSEPSFKFLEIRSSMLMTPYGSRRSRSSALNSYQNCARRRSDVRWSSEEQLVPQDNAKQKRKQQSVRGDRNPGSGIGLITRNEHQVQHDIYASG